MELSKINVENRERIKEVLGLNDGSLVKMHENDLLNELLETIEFFDDEDKNKFIPRIRDLTDELETLANKVQDLEAALEKSKSQKADIVVPAAKTEVAPANDANKIPISVEDHENFSDTVTDLLEKTKKQINSFLKKKLSVVENGELESIHPKQKELEEEVLLLAKENSDLNALIIDDMDLIDALMAELKKNNIEWKHTLVDKRATKLKHFAVGYQPFGRLFLYKKLLSIPSLELSKK